MKRIAGLFLLFLTGISNGQFDYTARTLYTGYKNAISLDFENDILTYPSTDRYYTNGIKLGVWTKVNGITPVNRYILPSSKIATVSYGISLVQRIYTPFNAKVPPLLDNDRPYASLLFAAFKKELSFYSTGLFIEGELDAGLIGPYTGGANLQRFIHRTLPDNKAPIGWETQIRTDPVINYSLGIEKLLFRSGSFSAISENRLRIGTLYDDLAGGLRIEIGNRKRNEKSQQITKSNSPSLLFFSAANANMVLYNSLLEGGIFNTRNIYTLEASQINKLVYSAEAGISIQYKKIAAEFSQIFVTPEFEGGLNHKWGRISLIMAF